MIRILFVLSILTIALLPNIVAANTSVDIAITATGIVVGAPVGFTVWYVNDHEIGMSWTKPAGATNTMIRAKYGAYPNEPPSGTQPTDGYLVYYGSAETTNDTSVSLDETATNIYYRAWSENATGIWSPIYGEDNVGGIGMTLLAFVSLALALTIAGFGLRSGRGILCFAATGAWIILGVYSYTQSAEEWDIYYALFWLSMGMSLVMPLTAALMRDKKDPVEDPYAGLDDDERAIVQEHESMARDEERLDRLMGKRKPHKSKLSSFSKTGIEKRKK